MPVDTLNNGSSRLMYSVSFAENVGIHSSSSFLNVQTRGKTNPSQGMRSGEGDINSDLTRGRCLDCHATARCEVS